MTDKHKPPINEEIAVAGSQLVDKVKELMREGSVRRLIVRRASGEAMVEIPLAAGIGIAGLLTLMTPVLAALGAMAALIADFRVEIERDPDQVADTAAKLPHDAGDDASQSFLFCSWDCTPPPPPA